MRRLLNAVAEAPVVVSGRQETGNYTTSLDYIPGTALRGAVAAVYLESSRLRQEIADTLQPFGLSFQDYFEWVCLSGRVRFPNLYPRKERLLSFPIPLSSRTCKRFPGFALKSGPLYDPRHGVFDVLLYEPPDFRCPDRLGDRTIGYAPCEAPMEPIEGFYEGARGAMPEGRSVRVSQRVLTRAAIENPTETAQQGLLYSLEAMEESGGSSPILAGLLIIDPPGNLPDPRGQIFVDLLTNHLNDPLARLAVGRAKTRGLGTIRLEVFEEEPPDILPSVEERFAKLQEAWRQLFPATQGEFVFTVTLHSDAILLDDLWRYSSVLDENLLAQENPDVPACKLKRRFTRTRLVSGWNAAHRMPKEDELAILKGSAFLYVTTKPPSVLLPWLQALEETGVGERRNEGFGQVITCHPFHWGGVYHGNKSVGD